MRVSYKLLLILLMANLAISQEVFNLTEYFMMPQLSKGDSYDKCIEASHDLQVFCAVNTFIKPDRQNPVWNIIEKYSNDTKRNYRHDITKNGLCISRCEKDLAHLSSTELDSLRGDYFDVKYQYWLSNDTFKGVDHYHRTYATLINQCQNYYLRENYNLSSFSKIVYCTTNQEESDIDGLDITFLVILCSIVVLLTAATLYDSLLNRKNDRSHYKESIENLSSGRKALLAFSITRNWYRLLSMPQTEESRILRYVQGFRFLTIFFVVYGHTLIGVTLGFTLNPYKIEESFHTVISHLSLNAFSIVQCFFSISGLLMALQFAELTSKHKKFNLNYFWIAIIYRYLRLTPVYFFMMLFDATWLYKSQNGPGWKRIGETERYYCRKNMWTNLLYVNNYVNVEEGCMPVTWYLAVDMQMFVIGLAVMMVIWRFPRIKKTVLAICVVIAVGLPGLLTYYYKFDGIFLVTPEDRRFLNHAEIFRKMYVPVHTNMGNYVFGMVTGLYCFYARTVKMPSKRMQKFILTGAYTAPILSFIVVGFHYVFYAYDFEKPSIWMACFAMITKNLWGFFGVFCTCSMVLKIEKFFINLLQMRIFQPLGRLTYCIYLCHFDLMRILVSEARENMFASTFMVIVAVTTVFFFANILALILCLCLEFPVTALLKQFLKKEMTPPSKKEDENKNIELSSASTLMHDVNSNVLNKDMK